MPPIGERAGRLPGERAERLPARKAVEYLLHYAVYRLMKGLLLTLPHDSMRPFGHRLGRVAIGLFPGAAKQALANLQLTMPELDEVERCRVVRACFAHFGAHWSEVLSCARFDSAEIERRFEIVGWEHVEASEAEGRGFFLSCGHYGSWEVALHPLQLRIPGFHAVARPPNNPWVRRDLLRLRTRFGATIIERAGAGHRILNAYREGGRVALVIDQRVRQSAGILVPFLGHPAWTSPVLAFLSIRTGAPVIPFACLPTERGRYRIEMRPPIEPEGKGRDAELALTRRYLADVERDIRRRPELWLWMHRRWDEKP